MSHRLHGAMVGIAVTIFTIDTPILPTRNIPPGRFLKQAGPRLIKRDVIPGKAFSQLVSGP